MQQGHSLNPNLPGIGATQTETLSEKLYIIGNEGMKTCFKKCVTHFGEDSVPYHPGEKACQDRCINKLYDSFVKAKEIRTAFDADIKAGKMPPWIEQLKAEP